MGATFVSRERGSFVYYQRAAFAFFFFFKIFLQNEGNPLFSENGLLCSRKRIPLFTGTTKSLVFPGGLSSENEFLCFFLRSQAPLFPRTAKNREFLRCPRRTRYRRVKNEFLCSFNEHLCSVNKFLCFSKQNPRFRSRVPLLKHGHPMSGQCIPLFTSPVPLFDRNRVPLFLRNRNPLSFLPATRRKYKVHGAEGF